MQVVYTAPIRQHELYVGHARGQEYTVPLDDLRRS